MLQQNKSLLSKKLVQSAVLNPQGSKTFLKQVVPLSVSFILHQRVEFDDKDFKTATYDGIKYKAFKTKLQNETLNEVRKWLNSAMNSLDQNYLREMYLILADVKDPTTIHESYKFQFKYLGDDVIHFDVLNTKEELLESTNSLLKSIESLNDHLKYKESEVEVKMAITYYEDVTPKDYIPEFFSENKESGTMLQQSLAAQPSDYMLLGILKSGHHTVKCRGKGEVFSIKDLADQSLDTSCNQEDEIIVLDDDDEEIPQNQESEVQDNQEGELQNTGHYNTTQVVALSPQPSIHCESIRCVCQITVALEYVEEVLCTTCATLQHCVCLGYLKARDVPQPYVCQNCTNPAPITYTPKTQLKKKNLGIYRLATAVAYFTEAYPEQILNKLPADMQEFQIQKLKGFKVIKKTDNGFIVNMELLRNSVIKGIFSKSFTKKRKLDEE